MLRFHSLCYALVAFSALSILSFIYQSRCSIPCKLQSIITPQFHNKPFNLLSFTASLNQLSFSHKPPAKKLKIALFVKKWPHKNLAGGLERHALTLHLALARRGHEIHVFSTLTNFTLQNYQDAKIYFHLTTPSPAGYINQALAWEQFQIQNTTEKPFDLIHSESVGLFHGRARNISNLAVSWHGIAYETIHSDIVQDLLRESKEPRHGIVMERLPKVIEEVKFFRDYAHHVATSDHVGDVLKRIYMIPEERVHIIVNGVDEGIYRPDLARGKEFRKKIGVPENATLVIGMAGRLVRDKGHPLVFEALKQIFSESEAFRQGVVILVAGNGPWGNRYKELGPNLHVLGPLEQSELAMFYNSVDIFLNPTLRAQGLDHTFIEAMLSQVPIMGTRFASITGSLIVSADFGYTFLPMVSSLKEALYRVLEDGPSVLKEKGETVRSRARLYFTATKMAAAYERLFLCIAGKYAQKSSVDYCMYPLPWDGSW